MEQETLQTEVLQLRSQLASLNQQVEGLTDELYLYKTRYKILAESRDELVACFRPDLTLTYVNEAYCQYFGRPRKEVLDHNFMQFVPQADHDFIKTYISTLTANQPVKIAEHRVVKPDGQICWLEWTDQVLLDEHNQIIEYQTVARDITALKQAEIALAEEREWLAVTLRSIEEGVISIDKTGRVVLFNPAAEKLTGLVAEEVIGKPFDRLLTLVDEQTRQTAFVLFNQVVQSGENASLGNINLNTQDNQQRLVSITAVPIFDNQKTIVGAVIIFTDTTIEHKRTQEMLKTDKLKSLGLLAGGIAHDFNNLLTVLLGNVSLARLLSQTGQDKNELVATLTEVEQATLRARELTTQLLTFAKGGAPIKRMARLGDIILDSARFTARGSKVACKFEIAPGLWPVEADDGQLSQVIQNLVLNGLQAMPDGGELVIEAVNCQLDSHSSLPLPGGNYVQITVRDKGTGITPHDLPHIFDPYFTTKAGGSGLGLSICYSIIKKHEGHLTVESEPGRGTSFQIYLPARPEIIIQSEPTSHSVNSSGETSIEPSAQEPPPRILVVDDEAAIRCVIGRLLNRLGYEVETVPDGEQALTLYQQAQANYRPFTAVILDLTIPGGMGGQETMQKLLTLNPQVKAIVSSGYSDDPIMANYRQYGFSGVISKPYRLNELKDVLKAIP